MSWVKKDVCRMRSFVALPHEVFHAAFKIDQSGEYAPRAPARACRMMIVRRSAVRTDLPPTYPPAARARS